MKSFVITLEDLKFLKAQVNVPILRVVRYETDGTPIYGYTVPPTGFTDPLTGQPFPNNTDPATNQLLPSGGSVVELGKIGTFDVFNTSWAYFLPPVVTAAGTTAAGVGEPFGLRNVQGLFNNIALPNAAIWGAAFYSFARNSAVDYGNYLQQSMNNPAWVSVPDSFKLAIQNSIDASGNVDLSQRYANPFLTVYDYTPRMISQTVDSNDALLRMDAAAGGGIITDTITYDLTDINTGAKTQVTESFQRNLNTLSGDPSLTGWNTLFGQFFDHGLDSIGKGGNTTNGVSSKVYIPLSPTDPLYRAPGTYGPNDPGNTKLYISRATVENPLAAGADGIFQTADDIQSPGADGIYGTPDDITGPTNPNYVNHVSPYIDQSQTYGSDDNVTNLLREWVKNPNFDPTKAVSSTNQQFIAGMYLLDGTTLANTYNRLNPDGTTTTTKNTLPTLNELRAHLLATGRDDLTWDDINNLRVRDESGHVLDLDPSTGGLQALLSDHTLIADMLPRIDADHLFNSPTVASLKATITSGTDGIIGTSDDVSFVDVLAGFDANHIQRPSDGSTADGSYISDYVNLQSGQPTALAMTASGGAILNEILLRSIGDHYVAGDGRANENFGLTAIHHVWHEDHNWQIDNLINIIATQQAADPTHTVSHAFQIDTGHGMDAKGNFVNASGNITWDQEKMFQASLLIVQSEYQHVAIDQYARGMSPNIPLFVQYDSGVNSDVTLDYSQVAFRFGHSQLRETIDTLDPKGSLTAAVTHYALEQAFLNPSGFAKVGPTAIAQGMSRQVSNEIDEIVTPALQQNLLGQATDLAAINIARGRDLGMPTLNNLRRQLSGGLTAELDDLQLKLSAHPDDTVLRQTYDKTLAMNAGLQAYNSWIDFGNNLLHPEALVNFVAAYSFDGDLNKAQLLMDLSDGTRSYSALLSADQTIAQQILGITSGGDLQFALAANNFLGVGGDQGFENIDAWNGGLAEKHVFLGELGSTFDAIFVDQMTRLINGDRFYYFWRFQLGLPIFTELNSAITTEQFKDVIERTTGAQHLVGNVFFMADSYVELGERPTDISSGAARDHKYGDLIGGTDQIGVYSIGGKTELFNGQITTISGQKYAIDYRPDIGVNPDGTPSKGFNSHEVIGGTDYKDYIDAGDGDDTIYGGKGNDVLLGNAGADHIYGEEGNDLIYGGSLPDFLDGGLGNDEIHGGDDADVLIGSEGNDKLFGEAFTDELHGDAGDDYLDGGLDADFIYGGSGQDVVVGGEGLDTTYGEWGDDRMFAGPGPDQLFGGYGDDILNPGFGGQNQNVNVDEALGEFGFNIVSFSDIGNTPLNHTADLNQQNINVSNVTPFGQLWVDIQGVEGSSSSDQIIGDAIDNWLIGGGNNDIISGGAGDDVLVADSIRLDKLIGTYDANGVLQDNGLLHGADKHFLDLLKSVPDFRFGDTVTLGSTGITYTASVNGTNDIATYAGALINFTITTIKDANGNTILGADGKPLGLRVVDNTGVETTAKGDILIGFEKLVFSYDMEAAATTVALINPATLPAATTYDVSLFYADVPGTISINASAGTTSANLTATVSDQNGFYNPTYQWYSSTNQGATSTAIPGANSLIRNNVSNNLSKLVVNYNDVFGAKSLTSQWVQVGTSGNNTIAGTTGGDILIGLNGDDTYTVDNVNDVVIENLNGGTDTVQSSISYTLGDNVENLTLTGTNNINGTGNSLVNTITGNSGNNNLYGTGNDSLRGGLGNDNYYIKTSDTVVESANQGTDTVYADFTYTLTNNVENLVLTGSGNIDGYGNGLANTLTGNGGNNILDGLGGADTMIGGKGDDTYYVNNVGDVVTELANEGIDTVYSTLTYSLSSNVENLTLTGTGNINGTGNDLSNVIIGNNGRNILDGGTGVDSLSGGAGNDTYIVDNVGDAIVEGLNQGTDLVLSSVSWSFSLGDNLENLTLTGSGNIDGTGNSANNVITGNVGNNTLRGEFGDDTLDGGLGADMLIGGLGNDTLLVGADTAVDTVVYNLGDGSDTVNQFVRGIGGDLLQFNSIANIDVRTVGGNTQFRLGDGLAGNAGFGTGTLLLTLNGVTGFNSANINNNILAGSTATSFLFN